VQAPAGASAPVWAPERASFGPKAPAIAMAGRPWWTKRGLAQVGAPWQRDRGSARHREAPFLRPPGRTKTRRQGAPLRQNQPKPTAQKVWGAPWRRVSVSASQIKNGAARGRGESRSRAAPLVVPADVDPVTRGVPTGPGRAAARQGGDEPRSKPAVGRGVRGIRPSGTSSTCQISTCNHKTTGYSNRVNFFRRDNGVQEIAPFRRLVDERTYQWVRCYPTVTHSL